MKWRRGRAKATEGLKAFFGYSTRGPATRSPALWWRFGRLRRFPPTFAGLRGINSRSTATSRILPSLVIVLLMEMGESPPSRTFSRR